MSAAAILTLPKPIAPLRETTAAASNVGSDKGAVFADLVAAEASDAAAGPSSDVAPERTRTPLSSAATPSLQPRRAAQPAAAESATGPSADTGPNTPLAASETEDAAPASDTASETPVVAAEIADSTTDLTATPAPLAVIVPAAAVTAPVAASEPGALLSGQPGLSPPVTADTDADADAAQAAASASGDTITPDATATPAATQALAALLSPQKPTTRPLDSAGNAASAGKAVVNASTSADKASLEAQASASQSTPGQPSAAQSFATRSSATQSSVPTSFADTLAAAPAPSTQPQTAQLLPTEASAEDAASPLLAAPAPAPAAAPTPPQIVVPTHLSHLSQATLETTVQIAAQIARKLDGRSTRFEMGLTPEGLGRVDISLDIDSGGRLTARLAFDNPLAATELRGKADELRRELTDAGFTIARDGLDFSERQPSSSGSGFDRQQGRAFASASRVTAEADLSQPAPAAWVSLSLTRSGVDMKV